MNKIDKFLHQAGAYFGGDGVNYDQFDPRKFAAIVRAEAQAEEREAVEDLLKEYDMVNSAFAKDFRARGTHD